LFAIGVRMAYFFFQSILSMLNYIQALRRTYLAQREIALIKPHVVSLTEADVANCRVLPDRRALLKKLPAGAECAEIGVAVGDFSQQILETCAPAQLHLIDLWSSDTTAHSKSILEKLKMGRNRADSAKELVERRFEKPIAAGTVQLRQGFSWEVVGTYEANTFDWVYLDAAHDFTSVLKDLVALKRVVKPEGLIAGHDYVRWSRFGLKFGVAEAVNLFCQEHGYELAYLTLDARTNFSYALRKKVT